MRFALSVVAIMTLAAGAAQAATLPGKVVFDRWCSGCHAPIEAARRQTAPPAGTYTLEQRYKGAKPAALEQRTDLASAYVKLMVRNGAGMMPQTRKTEISDAALEALARYLAKSNP